MRSTLKHWLGNLALAFGALVTVLAFLEFVVFGLVLKPDDAIANVSIDGVVRYEPGRVAVFRHPDGRESNITINRDGWNSTYQRYSKARHPGKPRIAVIGDSYVHASYLDTADAFPEVLERRLKQRGIDAEVYRFGMDGAPLSQYLHVLRRVVMSYKPDIVLVQLIHNDFDESYRFLKTRYASSFMKLDIADDESVMEIAPADFQPTSADMLRTWATFRYLYYETNLYLTAKSFVSRYFWGGEEDYDPAFTVSGVDIRKLDDPCRMSRAADYAIEQMAKLADQGGFKLVLAMDGVRETIYGRDDDKTGAVAHLNEIASLAAKKARVPLLDLTEFFRADYHRNATRFEYSYDWHWNERTNRLVGARMADWLVDDLRLYGSASAAASQPTLAPASQPDQPK